MSEGLDFTGLSDDQIVELATALAHEALRRTPALAAAFEQALVSERERVEAAARGIQAARASMLRHQEELSRRAGEEQVRETVRQRQRDAMSVFLRRAAALCGRDVSDVTLVWNENQWGTGPRLQLNAGTSGDTASWHLVNFKPQQHSIHTSPGLQSKTAELLTWARETCAGARALGLRSIILQGIEL